MNTMIEEEILRTMQGHIKALEDRTAEENTEINTEMKVTVEIEVGVGLEKDHF